MSVNEIPNRDELPDDYPETVATARWWYDHELRRDDVERAKHDRYWLDLWRDATVKDLSNE